MDRIIGRNPVAEALRAGRGFDRLLVQRNAEGSIRAITAAARERGVPIHFEEKQTLDREAGVGAHQGVIAFVSDFHYAEIDEILAGAAARGEAPFVMLLDGVADPRNLGAIIRTAEGAGAHGVVIPKRRAAGVTETVAKVAAGATEYLPVARVANIRQTLLRLKEAGLWTLALDLGGENCYGRDLTGGIAAVIGGEGGGVSRLVKETCDFTLSVPMNGRLNSLNAASAAAVVMYEIRRQRTMKTGG